MPRWPLRTVHARFWEKVDRAGPDECWPWTATTNGDGYGQFTRSTVDRHVLAHRMAWELTHGEIPAGMNVLHTCDVRPCVNPAHLFLGTQSTNLLDASRKGRLNERSRRNLRSWKEA